MIAAGAGTFYLGAVATSGAGLAIELACIGAGALLGLLAASFIHVEQGPDNSKALRPVEKAQASAPGGSTKRSGVRGSAPPLWLSREPCRPRLGAAAACVSAIPAWAVIHVMTAAKSAPSARIAARSTTSPPEA
jgi:hypothetical protein